MVIWEDDKAFGLGESHSWTNPCGWRSGLWLQTISTCFNHGSLPKLQRTATRLQKCPCPSLTTHRSLDAMQWSRTCRILGKEGVFRPFGHFFKDLRYVWFVSRVRHGKGRHLAVVDWQPQPARFNSRHIKDNLDQFGSLLLQYVTLRRRSQAVMTWVSPATHPFRAMPVPQNFELKACRAEAFEHATNNTNL